MSCSDTLLRILKDNGVRLITYVPGNVLTPVMVDVSADNYFLPVVAPREDEAIRALRSSAAGS
jgi:sulfopyruvate decarboxylase TPP-binding subunit